MTRWTLDWSLSPDQGQYFGVDADIGISGDKGVEKQ